MVQISDPPGGAVEPCVRCGRRIVSPKVGVAPLRREQIVRATIRCLAREGYSGLTMKKVARLAGVSPGILHYYFTDKRALLVAALETVTADLDRRGGGAPARGGPGPPARLRALVPACLGASLAGRGGGGGLVRF